MDTPFYQTFILHASFEGIHVGCIIIIAIPFSRLGFLVRDFRVLNLLSSFSRIFFFLPYRLCIHLFYFRKPRALDSSGRKYLLSQQFHR